MRPYSHIINCTYFPSQREGLHAVIQEVEEDHQPCGPKHNVNGGRLLLEDCIRAERDLYTWFLTCDISQYTYIKDNKFSKDVFQ